MEKTKFIHDIKLNDNTPFCKAFNLCSDLWEKSQDESLSKEEQESYLYKWYEQRKLLELGIY